MKLLILTQKVDASDDILGFFHQWVLELAKNYEQIIVICLMKGRVDLPPNVKLLSLGKETRPSRWVAKLLYIWNFYKYIWRERYNYDRVLVHMNKEYVLLGGLFWKLTGKKICLWYTHGGVSWALRLAEKIVDVVLTASQESFRVRSDKIRIVGHGIDAGKFKKIRKESDGFKIITVGRISPIKGYGALIQALVIVAREYKNFKIDIIGGPATGADREYFELLKQEAKEKGLENFINFLGPISYQDVNQYFSGDLFVHMSQTGSLDKVALEAMSSEMPVISNNQAVVNDVLGKYRSFLSYQKEDAADLADKITKFMAMPLTEREELGRQLRKIVVSGHDLAELIKKITFYVNE